MKKSIFEMTPKEYEHYLIADHKKKILNGMCPDCLGKGDISDAGIFSSRHKCETCNGKGRLYDKSSKHKK